MSDFGGDKKVGKSWLYPLEQWFLGWAVPRVPNSVETYHLTMMTVAWSALVVLFSYFAQFNIHWLWPASGCVLGQYVTDLLDGAVGRARNTGLVRWGYYMDHLLDYIFLCSVLIGYSFFAPADFQFMFFFILAICGGYMVHSYLEFGATNRFQITYLGFGPSEIRIFFVVINTLLIVFGRTYIRFTLPAVLAIVLIGFVVVVWRAHKTIWELDMERKKKIDDGRKG